MKTPEILARSVALPVSFSTIDARINASYGFLIGKPDCLSGQALSMTVICALAARWRISTSGVPIEKIYVSGKNNPSACLDDMDCALNQSPTF